MRQWRSAGYSGAVDDLTCGGRVSTAVNSVCNVLICPAAEAGRVEWEAVLPGALVGVCVPGQASSVRRKVDEYLTRTKKKRSRLTLRGGIVSGIIHSVVGETLRKFGALFIG